MPEPTTSETPTVLIVDDNRPLADGFEKALQDECETHTAYTAAEARETLRDDVDIDVVLLDRHLPDAPGDKLLEEIRDDGYDCRVAMVSAYEQTEDLDYDRYLTKPLSGVETVRETVAELFDGTVSR